MNNCNYCEKLFDNSELNWFYNHFDLCINCAKKPKIEIFKLELKRKKAKFNKLELELKTFIKKIQKMEKELKKGVTFGVEYEKNIYEKCKSCKQWITGEQ